jgi:hypothetical protein
MRCHYPLAVNPLCILFLYGFSPAMVVLFGSVVFLPDDGSVVQLCGFLVALGSLAGFSTGRGGYCFNISLFVHGKPTFFVYHILYAQ